MPLLRKGENEGHWRNTLVYRHLPKEHHSTAQLAANALTLILGPFKQGTYPKFTALPGAILLLPNPKGIGPVFPKIDKYRTVMMTKDNSQLQGP